MALDISTARLDIAKVYIAAFNRAPDASGLDFWTKAYVGGSSLASIANGFASSAEYANKYPSFLTNAEYVSSIYTNVFGRAVDDAGKAYWTAALDAGTVTKATLLNALVSAATSSATNTDGMRLNNMADFGVYSAVNGLSATATNSQLITITSDSATLTAAKAGVGTVNTSYALTTGIDTASGTINNDSFTAYILDNSNTLNSGDKIFGGSGTDTLTADIGNAQAFAITPHTSSVEKFIVRAEADNVKDSNDNNMFNNVQIDAERMVGTNWYETNSSRADLVIEDVRIEDTQITKDITIAMVSTDPGDVDFGVYFDQLSLRPETAATSGATLKLQIIDLENAKLQNSTTGNLVNDPAWGFYFTYGGTKYEIAKTAAFRDATTYDALKTLIENDIKAKGLEGKVTVSVAVDDFTRFDDTGVARNGSTITLTSTTSSTFADTTLSANAGWLYEGAAPSNANTSYKMTTGSGTTSPNLITSEIVLDNVGRGSMGGDLLIGGLSTGDTSTSKGVEQFNIYVDRNSKLQTINSTNNTLEEVYITNRDHSEDSDSTATGNLVINGSVVDLDNNSNGASQLDVTNDASDNTNDDLAGDDSYDNAYGLSNVRVVDASGMTGNVTITAELDGSVVAKYFDLLDTATDVSADNDYVNDDEHPASNDSGHTYGKSGFVYTMGKGSDSLTLDISGANSNTVATTVNATNTGGTTTREDFVLTINGGEGADKLNLKIVNPTNDATFAADPATSIGSASNWYNNHDLTKNITVNGGTGDDTIRTYGVGDITINGDENNDVVYADNTGEKATWVLNTTNQVTAASTSRTQNDLRSDNNNTYNLAASTLTVSFKGLTSTVAVKYDATAYTVSDLQINQTIKEAINSNAVLSKLLLAQDGPANTLVITSLIDGDMTTGDLNIAVTAPTTLTATQITAMGAKYGIAAPTEALVLAAIAASKTAFDTKGDYVDNFTNGAAAVSSLTDNDGGRSFSTSDNTITGGTGDDIIVLGTTFGTDTTRTTDDSNDTVVYNAAFGNDTIVHFLTSGAGVDALDFSSLGTTLTAAATVVGTNNTAAEVQATLRATNDTVTTAATANSVYLSVNGNKATVYQVTNGTAVNDLTATEMGTITLAVDQVNNGAQALATNTGWSTLVTYGTLLSPKIGYSGSTYNTGTGTGSTGSTGTGTGGTGTTTASIAVTAAGSVTDTSTVNTTYTVTAGNYTYSIAGFGAGDKIDFPADNTPTVVNSSYTDGSVTLQYANAGVTTLVTLTGLSSANDIAINSITDVNTVFGTGTIF